MQAQLFLVLGALLTILSACASVPGPAEARTRARVLLDEDPQAALDYIDGLDSPDMGLQLLRGEAALRVGARGTAAETWLLVAENSRERELADLARRNLALLQLQDGQPVEAYATLAGLSDQAKRSHEVQRDMGVTAVAAGRLDLARTHFATLPEEQRHAVEVVLGGDFLRDDS